MCPNCYDMRYSLLATFVVCSLTTSAQVPDYVPTDGLVGWWPMNGNAVDESGHNTAGSVHGPTATSNRFDSEFSALVFDGIDDWVSLGDLNPISSGEIGEASFSFWIKVETLNSADMQAVLIGDEYAQNNGILYQLSSDYGFGAYIAGSQNWDGYCSCFPPLNQWHHVVFVQSANTTDLYLNGGHFANLIANAANSETSRPYRLGGFAPEFPSRFYDGKMDDLAIFDRPLTEQEILLLYLANEASFGCTDSTACNFDSQANFDDGSCLALDACDECGGVEGCTNLEACNYNPNASCEDGSCVYPPSIDLGADIETCNDSVTFVTLDAGAGFDSYLWSTGDASQSIQVDESGEYGVFGTLQLEQAALLFDGQDDYVETPANPSFNFESALSFGVWVKISPGNYGWNTVLGGYYDHGVNVYAGSSNSGGAVRVELPGVLTLTSNTDLRDNQWHHVMVVYDGSAVSIWIDGQIEISEEASGNINPDNDGDDHNLYLGRGNHFDEYFEGAMALPELWNIALSPESIQSHFQCPPSGEANGLVALWQFDDSNGTLVPDASGTGNDGQVFGASYSSDGPSGLCSAQCHTSASDTISVQLFTYSCLCGEGAFWDEVLGGCVGEISADNACQEGTIWSEIVGGCIVANPSDTDFDGCVGMTDLLDLLSVFGTCNEIPWSCGDPLEYQGYDYETVQIGEQCWFAENSRYLPAVSPSSNGSEIDGNAHAYVFEYEGQDIQEARALENYESYGVLYNRIAMQTWDVCPAGWHIPTDSNISGQGEFRELIAQFVETEVAVELKSDFSSTPGWNGSNNSGFDALPAGYRRVHSTQGYGFFGGLGDETQYWADETWSRRLTTTDPDLSFMGTSEHWGLSVRCIKDSE